MRRAKRSSIGSAPRVTADAVLALMRITDINTRAIRYLTGDRKRWRDRKRTPPV